MFASRFPSSQLSKNASFPTVEKRLVLHYTSAAKDGDGHGEVIFAAKNAKVAKIGGRGLSAFAHSAFSYENRSQ